MNVSGVDPWGGVTPRGWQAESLLIVMRELSEGRGPLVSVVTGAGKSYLQRAVTVEVLRRPKPGVVVIDVPSEALVEQLARTLAEHPALQWRVGRYYGKSKNLVPDGVIVACRDSLPRLATALRVRGWPVRLWIADEAHLSPDRQVAWAAEVGPARMLGVTATPYRSGATDVLPLWDRVVYRWSMSQAVAAGDLLLPTIVGARRVDDLDAECARLIAEHVAEDPRRRVVCNAVAVADAEAYAERLAADGIGALAVHAKMPMKERDRRRDMLRDGEIGCLVHVATLVEGVDWPWLTTIALRRQALIAREDPRKGGSRVRLVQEVGRCMRARDGKPGAWVIDQVGVLSAIGLVHGEALAADADEAGEEEEADPQPVSRAARNRKAREAVLSRPMMDWEGWIGMAHEMGVAAGLIQRDPDALRRMERASAPTSAQVRAMRDRLGEGEGRAKRIYLPRRMAAVLEIVMRRIVAGEGSRGLASDVLALAAAGGRAYHAEHTATGRYPSGDGTWWRAVVPPMLDGIDIDALEGR
jgi:superfamily II DNA or RNA helicase